MLSLEDVRYRYAGARRDSLRGVSLQLAEGSITGLVGPAEAGKSTLCLVLGGLAPRVIGGDLRGSMAIDGEDVTTWRLDRLGERVVVGLQDPGAQLSMVAETVYEEVAFGPLNLGLPRDEVLDRVDDALMRLALGGLAKRDPRRLSGGQQQLVVLAGLLAMRPRFLVLDEPLAHLDARGVERVMETLADVAAAGAAVLLAEQRTEVMVSYCRRVAVIAAGNIVREGPAEIVLSEPSVLSLGVTEPTGLRLRRLVAAAGADVPDAEGGP